jgi:membrane carboxypeptidase/penicillin-binding protein PbpC
VPLPFLPETGSELASRAGQKPIIVSPNSKEILLASKKTIPLRAQADADVREISWFADKQFIGKAAQNQALEWPTTAGDCEVTSLDDHGRGRFAYRSCSMKGNIWLRKLSSRRKLLNPNPGQTASQ